ncbi:MAG: iron-sulfur cluster assembly accessory protein [Pseudomonadota bacterium]
METENKKISISDPGRNAAAERSQPSPRSRRRERPKVVKLTDAAASRMQAIMANADEDYIGVKIGVKNGGCAGMEYTMDYAEEVGPLDETVEDNGIKILIDPKAILFLIGTEIDFVREKLSQKFVFNNPNQTDACGCGESVTITPAAQHDA